MSRPLLFASVLCAICLTPSARHVADAQEAPAAPQYDAGTVLHIESREALIDVIARDSNNLPIGSLTAGEFQVYELPQHGRPIPQPILSTRAIDPGEKNEEEDASSGFHVSSGAVCALDALVHYRIAISASSQPGYHTVLIKTTRPHINLTYRRRYFVGFTHDNATPNGVKKLVAPKALEEAACYHPLTPPTLELTAKVLDAPGGESTRYAVVVKPESLGDIGATGEAPRVQLDFGVCVFDAAGEVVRFLHSTVDHRLNPADMERLPTHGFVSLLEAPGSEPPALARLAVLDRITGNLGVVDVSRPLSVAAQAPQLEKRRKLAGDIRVFGSVTPSQNAFCGDVYELQPGVSSVSELDKFDPVGSIYSNTLSVPNQDITRMGGIPGITHSSVWFGVDYYGKFYISKPGEYTFELQSDDGSRLDIDNRGVLIDLDGVHPVDELTATTALSVGWHSVHVPYFQGPPTSLALVLRIQPPGEAMRPFNLNEFVPQAEKP